MKRIAIYKDEKLINIALWNGDMQWWDTMIQEGYLLEDITNEKEVHLDESPLPIADQLDLVFKSLTDNSRAAFYGVKTAVKTALEENDLVAARLIIQNTSVPAELEDEKTVLLNILNT